MPNTFEYASIFQQELDTALIALLLMMDGYLIVGKQALIFINGVNLQQMLQVAEVSMLLVCVEMSTLLMMVATVIFN